MEELVNFIVKNWDKIPDKFKQDIRDCCHTEKNYIENLPKEEHLVILLLDRQKPSVESCYDFDEERIGVTKTGKIIWGFDSGCSCPSPWDDSYPECYKVSREWKEFEINIKEFDKDWEKECQEKFEKIKNSLCK